MTITDYAIDGPTALSRERFGQILREAGSPAANESDGMYLLLRNADVRPEVFLAFFMVESRYGTVGVCKDFDTKNPGNVRAPERATTARTIVQTPRGPFAKYPTWADGAADWAARMVGPKYAGRGLLTVRAVLPVYAPPSDQDNDPDAYARTVLQKVTEWVGTTPVAGTGGTMGHVPQPPWTDHPITKVVGVGRDPDAQRAPKFVVLHSMGGTLKGTDGYFPRPEVAALTDFGIGQVDAGGGFAEIIRWNDPFGKQIGWASGPVKTPEGDGPRILALFGGAAGLNRYGVSIEHDDTTKAGGGTGEPGSQPVSAPQWSATCWLQAFIHAEWLHQTASTFDYNAWHREFCGAAYKTCPNPRITDHVDEYQAAIKAIMAHFQEGAAYPAGGLVVNGLRLATPPEGGTTPPAPPAASGESIRHYVNAQGVPVTEVVWGGKAKAIRGGNIVDLGISVDGDPDGVYHRSVQANAFKEWVKE